MLDYKEKVSSLKNEWEQLRELFGLDIPMDEKNRFIILLNSLFDEFWLLKGDLLDKKNKILFPLSQSESPTDKLMGLIEVMSAIIFYSSPRKENQILDNLSNALCRKRFDYSSTLIEYLLTQETGSSRSDSFRNKVNELIKTGYSKMGLNDVELDLQKIETWSNDLISMKKELPESKPIYERNLAV